MMHELNHQTLHAALQHLPDYDPPEALWDSIETALETDMQMTESLAALPQYEPPMEIWANIESKLAQTDNAPKRVMRRVVLFQRVAAAAAIIGVIMAAWWLIRPATTNVETIAISQEVVDNQIIAATKEPEDDAFDLVQNLCQESAPVCQQPEFKALKTELDELTIAKNELKEALGQYGDDPDMTAQLVRIERERSELLQQMMQMI